jgi:phospholipase C
LIPANTVDHRVYDHASIPATVEKAFGLAPLTARDAAANNVLPLLSLARPRTDAPKSLPAPARLVAPKVRQRIPKANETVDSGNLPSFVLVAMRLDLDLSPPSEAHAILSRVQAIHTRGQAEQYIKGVQRKLKKAKAAKSAR